MIIGGAFAPPNLFLYIYIFNMNKDTHTLQCGRKGVCYMNDIKTITSVPELMNEWGCETIEDFIMFAESMAVVEEVNEFLHELEEDIDYE
jgi:hypothetical protein